MTAQIPERIILADRPYWVHEMPLYPVLEKRGIKIRAPDAWTTACHRQYVGTWAVSSDHLWLLTLSSFGYDEAPLTDTARQAFLEQLPAERFPIRADWFDGSLRIPVGPMLIRGFHGWSSWFTRERVITCRQGRVVRDREVDTLAMLERALRRNASLRHEIEPEDRPGSDPRSWITADDYAHLEGDWWPPGWDAGRPVGTLGSWFTSGTWFSQP